MQVFLPYPDLEKSVRRLDPKRLGNQVYRECLTLIRGGWPNHPASRMWRGYEGALARYMKFGIFELLDRGYDYRQRDWAVLVVEKLISTNLVLPPWLGDDRLHSSHRAALLYKNYDWYSKFGWSEKSAVPDENGRLPYYWPTT